MHIKILLALLITCSGNSLIAQNINWPFKPEKWNLINVTKDKDAKGRYIKMAYVRVQRGQPKSSSQTTILDFILKTDSVVKIYTGEKITEITITINGNSHNLVTFEILSSLNTFLGKDIKDEPRLNSTAVLTINPNIVRYSYKEANINTHLNISKTYRNNFFAWKKNPNFLFRFSGSILISHRQFKVHDASFSWSEALNQRSINEKPVINSAEEFSLGIKINKSNYITIPFVNLNQGFKSVNTGIDWQTGLPTTGPGKSYNFNFNGFGIGYSYNNLNKAISPRVDAQLLWMKMRKYKESGINFSKNSFNDQYLMGSFGFGANFRLTKVLSLGIVPTVYYDFTPIQRKQLQTRLYNIGINFSFTGGFWL